MTKRGMHELSWKLKQERKKNNKKPLQTLTFSGQLHTCWKTEAETVTDFSLWNNKSAHTYRWDKGTDWELLSIFLLWSFPLQSEPSHSWSHHYHGEQKPVYHVMIRQIFWSKKKNQPNKNPTREGIKKKKNRDNLYLSLSLKTHLWASSLFYSVSGCRLLWSWTFSGGGHSPAW